MIYIYIFSLILYRSDYKWYYSYYIAYSYSTKLEFNALRNKIKLFEE